MTEEVVERAARWSGHRLEAGQWALLRQYATWLRDEAIPAGGLGPREGDRLWARHLGDSLTFATGWTEPPEEILDVGTGVGLPGIPLAILWPTTRVTLLDRGGRRVRLLHRVVRMLALGNVTIAQGDVFSVADEWAGITYRGSVRAPEAVALTARLLQAEGRAVLGVSRRPEEPERATELLVLAETLGLGAELRRVPDEVLDGPSWLLIMRS
jgi:16S rRNA (guanine527-N7)-methyltransferase